MSSDIKEYKVEEYDNAKKVMYFVKEILKSSDKINIISGTNSSKVSTRAAETLVRFGYVTFDNIQTLTEVKNDRRVIRLIITLKKTGDFDKLYKKKEEEKKKSKLKEKITNKKNKINNLLYIVINSLFISKIYKIIKDKRIRINLLMILFYLLFFEILNYIILYFFCFQ